MAPRRLALVLSAAYGLTWVANRSLRTVVGQSMQPSLWPGDRLLVAPARLRRIRRGAVVLAADPRCPRRMTLKRIVGLPGESIVLGAGGLAICGVEHVEPYVAPGDVGAGVWELGPDEVVVLGDNRAASTDSRVFGPVPRGLVQAVVLLRVWPPRVRLRAPAEPAPG